MPGARCVDFCSPFHPSLTLLSWLLPCRYEMLNDDILSAIDLINSRRPAHLPAIEVPLTSMKWRNKVGTWAGRALTCVALCTACALLVARRTRMERTAAAQPHTADPGLRNRGHVPGLHDYGVRGNARRAAQQSPRPPDGASSSPALPFSDAVSAAAR